MTTSIHFRLLFFAAIFLIVVGCSRNNSLPPPATATVNGVTKVDKTTGRAEFSISALNEEGTLLTSGKISGASATVEQAGFSAQSQVCQDGEITSLGPLTTLLTLDASGSMATNDRDRLRAKAAKEFVVRMSGEDRAAVASFTGTPGVRVWEVLTSDKTLLDLAIDRATSASGATNLWGASTASIDLLNKSTGNKTAIIFTDGEDTESLATPDEVINNALLNNTRVFMIGLARAQGDIDESEMIRVASSTNGFYRDVRDATGLEQLFNLTFNAAKASGCIGIGFTPVPVAGSSLSGELRFKVNGKAFTGAYSVTF